MSSVTPQIGFDRFIQLDWAAAALRVRAGVSNIEQLTELIDATHSGAAAKKKTRTVLNRLWLEPRPDLVDFADRGIRIYREAPDTPISALTWGMAIATYPFFGKVAEIVGRLTALQGDCASTEVHRRMAETYGEREGTRRMTNMVLQSQASWGAIERMENSKRLVRKSKMRLNGSPISVWLAEACMRYMGRGFPVTSLETSPIIYPFELSSSITYLLSKSTSLEIHTDSAGNQIVALAS
ncbi:hypothetical protein LB557_18885 [Mesorhizobium sp. BR115XR7A]|uniref:hypothetical protein n=1 Tax=Mesorhizobium sp. BR115XR7A TaxID=2876645 RepID=UPI001CD06A56|nr:hypothetical protein [Mesorhizobium sp. BR115XR7A]MBZ9908080.1 hypothetical protein [Mesorhizobium sp. BR115XR7A]